MTFYASTQAGPDLLNYALTLRQQGHQVKPLIDLPPPRPARLASLRVEQQELVQEEQTIRWTLDQYAQGLLLPDACHENGLLYQLDAVGSRLRAVTATLQALTVGGQTNG